MKFDYTKIIKQGAAIATHIGVRNPYLLEYGDRLIMDRHHILMIFENNYDQWARVDYNSGTKTFDLLSRKGVHLPMIREEFLLEDLEDALKRFDKDGTFCDD